jgi:hypothetical protein
MSDIFGAITSEVVQDVPSVKANEDSEMTKKIIEKSPKKSEDLSPKLKEVEERI